MDRSRVPVLEQRPRLIRLGLCSGHSFSLSPQRLDELEKHAFGLEPIDRLVDRDVDELDLARLVLQERDEVE